MNDETPETLGEVIEFGFNTMLGKKWTASPAIIEKYNANTKRAMCRIVPLPIDNSESVVEYPLIPDVPVMWQGGGGFTVTAPLTKGDSVLLVFCRRGISNFKKDYKEVNESGGVMQIDSAVAIPCFGALSIDGSSTGLSLQKNDGSVKVEVLDDSIKMTTGGDKTMTLGADGKVVALDFVTTTGISLLSHTHPAPQAASGTLETEIPTIPPA